MVERAIVRDIMHESTIDYILVTIQLQENVLKNMAAQYAMVDELFGDD